MQILEEDKFLPVAITNGPYSRLINQSISLDASSSYDPDGIIVNYTWDLGDGTKKSGIKTIHFYSVQGTYSIVLTVTDNDGLIDTDKTTAHIFSKDSDEDGWGDNEENIYGTDPNNPNDYPLDSDKDRIPDSEDNDDDNDGLSDKFEEKHGSNPKYKFDVLSISINGLTHFLIDSNKDDKSDLFYNSRTGKTIKVDLNGKNQYLVDEDGDGQWDYLYDPIYGTLMQYKEEESSSYLVLMYIAIILIVLIISLIIVIQIFYKKS
jgi:hypothetical protein